MVKMIIYDCDGVIFESKRANLEYYNYILKNFNLPLVKENDLEKLEIIHTFSNDEVIKRLFPEPLIDKAIKFSQTVDYSKFYKFMKMEPEFKETCLILKSKGIITAIATNRSRTFPNLFKYFNLDEVIVDYVTVSIVKNPKPAPDMLIYLLNKHKIHNKEAFYIGDSRVDYIASEKAKIKFFAYKVKINDSITLHKHSEILKFV